MRSAEPDQDLVPLRLRAGRNDLLFRVSQVSLGHALIVRITAPDGSPPQGVTTVDPFTDS
jgi:hypothetical protein